MAADSAAASGHGARSSSAALEASLDRKFQGVSNTMESIQSLSNWCIENKKHHGLIVRYWMRWLKKSDNSHRLNLFYLANDVIQNCKRKNAIVFRSSFGEVLPNAAQLISGRDPKVSKSVERIFSIWAERSVYPEELITQLKTNLSRKDKEREKQKQKEKEREKEREKEKQKEKEKDKKSTPSSNVSANNKAALKSKILAEFTPLSLIEQLTSFKKAVAEEEYREKQLAALRVDVCSTEALKRLKDKAGGNKFAKDFEEGSLKLQEFVSFLDKRLPTGAPLLDSLGNADIFYEMQYKEVKIVANAYNAFANRVASLKRKLDSLKETLPGPDDSPIPSPSEDAPSPTGSVSPYLGPGESRAQVDPELDGKAMDDGDLPPDNRDIEDMDVSDEEENSSAQKGDAGKKTVPAASVAPPKVEKVSLPPTSPVKGSKVAPIVAPIAAPATPPTPTSTQNAASNPPLGVNLAKVDLGKISSILSSLTSAMKNTAAPTNKPTPAAPSAPTAAAKSAPPSTALASILSRVDITPEGILSALSKTNTTGLSSLLQSVATTAAPPVRPSAETVTTTAATPPKPKPAVGPGVKLETPGKTKSWEKDRKRSLSPTPPPSLPAVTTVSPPSLESKINSFLQGNPCFSLALGDLSPDGVDGTPVRDEAAGTPTQDEMMDTPGSVPESLGSSVANNLSPTAYCSDPWDAAVASSGGDFQSSTASRYGAKKGGAKIDDGLKNERKKGSEELAKGVKNGQQNLKLNARGERRQSLGPRSLEEGAFGAKADRSSGKSPDGDGKDGSIQRIETLVSPCTEGAPIQTVGYSSRRAAGEPIKTVESIRVIGQGSRRGGGSGGRAGASMWYEEEEYLGAEPPSPHTVPPPLNSRGIEDMSSMPPPPAIFVPLPPPPPPPHLLPPLSPFQMGFHADVPPPHLHPPPVPHFFSVPPPIPRPPPPPIRQHQSPPTTPTGPMDRPLSRPHPGRLDDVDHGTVGPRGKKVGSNSHIPSLLGEPLRLPRPGTVKEHLVRHHTPPIHRPGAPGIPPPLLGRVKEPSRPLPSPPPKSSPSRPDSPMGDPGPTPSPTAQEPPSSPPDQAFQPPHAGPLLPSPPCPIPYPQRPMQQGPGPSHHFNQGFQRGGYRGTKRRGPQYASGPLYRQKRPYIPPHF